MYRQLAVCLLALMLAPLSAAQVSNPERSADHTLAHARQDGFHALCFDSHGAIITPPGRADCVADFNGLRTGVIARDEEGKPLYEVFKGAKRPNYKTLHWLGLKDASGRTVAAAEFTEIDPLTPDFVFAKKGAKESYLIRVSDGARRIVPYDGVVPTAAHFGRPMLLGRDYRPADKTWIAWLLDADGKETGGKIMNFYLDPHVRTRDLHRLPAVVDGIVRVPVGFSDGRYLTALGEPVLPGKTLSVDAGVGVMAPVASGPRLPGHAGEPAYFGLVGSSGQVLPMAADVRGITRLWDIWFVVRETAGRLGFEMVSGAGGRPDLAGPPVNPVYQDVMKQGRWYVVKDDRGWRQLGGADVWTTPEAAFEALEAGHQAELAAIEAEKERQRIAEANARSWAISALRADVERASQYKPTDAELESLYRRWADLAPTLEQVDMSKLPSRPTPQQRYCASQPRGFCDDAIPWSSSFYTGPSTVDNMQYLRDQYTSNCAAASMGASRPCWTP